MARRLLLEIIADPTKALAGLRKTSAGVTHLNESISTIGPVAVKSTETANAAVTTLNSSLKKSGFTAEQTVKKQAEASLRRDAFLRQEILSARQLAAASAEGSSERITLENIAIQKERQLAGAMSVTAREARIHAANVAASDISLSRAVRGAAAGSGLFKSLGRSLAFASGGFIAFAGVSTLFRRSIEEASRAAATERQLSTQFKAGGLDFKDYKDRLEEATISTSRLSGFTRDELSQSFLQAFRGARDFDAGLKLMEASADAARGTGKGLNVVTLALTKAFLGQTGAARRLGILIPANVKGVQALDFVIRRFRGQAEAGTTAQERFSAALQLTEVTIGTALLPEIQKVLNNTNDWLLQAKNQEKIQHDVNEVVHDGALIFHGLADAIHLVEPPIKAVTALLGGLHDAVEILLATFGVRKLVGLFTAEEGVGTAAATSAGKVDLLTASLARLTAGPWILTAIVAVKDIQDPGSIPRRARGLLNTIRNAGPNLEQGLESLPTIGPVIRGIHLGAGPSKEARHLRSALDKAEQQFLDQVLSETLARPGTLKLPPAGPLGFKAKFADQELKLAQAQLTSTQLDDRRVLQVEARLIRERIKRLGNARSTLAERTQLTQQLVGIESQITSVDQKSFQDTVKFKRLELQLAQAQLTATQTDDKAILQAEAKAIQSRLATLPKTKATLDARIQLTQQLGSIEGQIASIDQQAKQNQLDALDKQKTAATNHLQKIQQKEQDLKDKIKAITDAFQQTVSNVRDQIGALFSGPVLQPTERQIKAKLGVRFEDLDPKALTADLNAQVKAFTAFEHGLAQLARRGAPKELLKELQQQGLAAAPEVQALAAASPADLRAFFKAFQKRERLAINSAKTEMRAQLVTLHADRVALRGLRQQEVKVEIEIKGIDRKAVKVRTRRTGTAGGRG